MTALLIGFLSLAMADWGPLPFEEEIGPAPIVKQHPPCSFHKLSHGMILPKDPELYWIRKANKAWGSPRMIDTLIRSAEEVAWLAPDAGPIVIGDISKKGGGRLPPHKSHQGGSDADVGIFYKDPKTGKTLSGLRVVTKQMFDHETNWIYIRALLNTGNVERILLDQKLVDELRKYVIAQGEMTKEEANRVFPAKFTQSVWLRHGVVHHASGHHHHYHIRTFCEKWVN